MEQPGGKSWGSAVHRTAEIVVQGGEYTEEAISMAAKQAVAELFNSELLRKRERDNLSLPEEVVTLTQIRGPGGSRRSWPL
jgi:hypothetical protein